MSVELQLLRKVSKAAKKRTKCPICQCDTSLRVETAKHLKGCIMPEVFEHLNNIREE